VVDESGHPVEGAEVDFGWNNLSGSQRKKTTSDAAGLFSLEGEQGKFLTVSVSKSGYYASKRDRSYFFYAGENENFLASVTDPVTFHLKEHGETESLIAWTKTYQISISGKPLELNLSTGEIAPQQQGDVRIEFVKGQVDSNQHRPIYDWRLRISAPLGGLLLSTNEFDFLAPESEYSPSDELHMPASLGDEWQAWVTRKYFVTLKSGNFARVVLHLKSHNGSLKVESFLNPSGSRNLEYLPQKTLRN
jgi:hypothetical protein